MIKSKQPKWQETNMALFGSDVEKKVKEAAAQGEPAWQNGSIGAVAGLWVFRIEAFNVKVWPKQGVFHKGDSYIVLWSRKRKPTEEALLHDVYFWIGSGSTQDEYGTAAYKTVELDDFLKGAAVQHREVEGGESGEFLALFKTMTVVKGGVDSGFNHVDKDAPFAPRVLRVKGVKGSVVVKEVKAKAGNLCGNDSFLVDAGATVWQWMGKTSNKDERARAAEVGRVIVSERSGRAKLEVVEEGGESDEFWAALGGKAAIPATSQASDEAEAKTAQKVIFQIVEDEGNHKISFTKLAGFDRKLLSPDNAYVVDDGVRVFAWVGSKASAGEKKSAMLYATQYIKENQRPSNIPITMVKEGMEVEAFDAALPPVDKKAEAIEKAKGKAGEVGEALKKKKKKCEVM